MNNIFCVGDGFAHGHIWPEWPQILAAILPQYQIQTITAVGAGNEFLINGLLQHDLTNQWVVFQWAEARRFDKLLQDQQWRGIGESDPTYHFNFYQRGSDVWWLSSASAQSEIRHYHDFYVQPIQALYRLLDQKKLLRGYLHSLNCHYVELSTGQQDLYSKQQRFRAVRGNEIQPSPIVHLAFLEEMILPGLKITVDEARLRRLQNLIAKTIWKPYDPDRVEIWSDIMRDLDTA